MTLPAMPVVGCALWTPTATEPLPRSRLIDPRDARRVSTLTLLLATAIERALEGTTLSASTVSVVFVSTLGEIVNTIELLERAQRGDGSPMRFRNSVHNTAIGHYGILTGNASFATALSATPERGLIAGLLEGIGRAAMHDEPVVVVWAEEGCPAAPDEMRDPIAISIALAPPEWDRSRPMPCLGVLRCTRPQPERSGEPAPLLGPRQLVEAMQTPRLEKTSQTLVSRQPDGFCIEWEAR